MQTYLGVDEFCKLVHLEREVIEDMIKSVAFLKTKDGKWRNFDRSERGNDERGA